MKSSTSTLQLMSVGALQYIKEPSPREAQFGKVAKGSDPSERDLVYCSICEPIRMEDDSAATSPCSHCYDDFDNGFKKTDT